MPTNQSSPWGGGKLQTRSDASSPNTTASVSAHARTVAATQVPFTPLELSGRTGRATSASPVKKAALAPSGSSVWGSVDARSQFTAVPDGCLTLPQLLHGIQIPNQVPAAGPKPAGSGFPKKEWQVRTARPETSDAPWGLEPLSFGPQDLFVQGQSSLRQTDALMLEAADGSSSPSAPPLCLTLCEHRGAAPGRDASRLQTAATTRRCRSAKPAFKCGRSPDSCAAASDSTNQLRETGDAPAGLAETKDGDLDGDTPAPECPTGSSLSARGAAGPPSVSAFANGPVPTALGSGAGQEQQPDLSPVVASSVGSVTTQISAIHLTKEGQPMSPPPPPPPPPPPSSSSSSSSSSSPIEECLQTGSECVMQVDAGEEELPDELENACSDDDDSDCSSINGASSTASTPLLSGVEEPMMLGSEDDREERPALVPSLFPLVPPTLYFSTAAEKVELLPAEQRRLLKWKMSTVTPNVVKHAVARSHFKVTKKSHDWLGCWGHHMKSTGFKALGEHQKLNHFPGTFQIGRKDRLWRNLSKMQVRFGKQEFSFFPRTFVLPQDIKLLRKAWEDGGSRQKWIIKPPASARGIGIQVIHKWSQMPRKRPLLVQKYLHKPYLIGGNKFDLRIYVYVTSYDPLRIYIFTDGLVRFASCKYSSSMKTLSNKFMHLTNYSVNKKNAEYQSNSDDKACQGHKWALKALWQYLGVRGVNTALIWEKIKDIVIKTVIASEPYVNSLLKMHVRTPYSCHELFGFDIMLDENLKPWILEVNISPSLHSNTALDVSIKGQMIRDLLNLAGFRVPQREDVAAPCAASSSTSSLCGGNRERTRPDLSADEKVKRAFYLTQRYADQDFLSTALDVLTPEDVRVLVESEDELNRRGEFERIFPSPSSSRYLRFFECQRYLTILLDQWEQKYWSDRTKGTSLLRSLCQKGVHLGTSDPAHVWSKSSYASRVDPHRPELASPSRARVVVSHHPRPPRGPDREVVSVSPSPGSSVAGSACASPQPRQPASL